MRRVRSGLCAHASGQPPESAASDFADAISPAINSAVMALGIYKHLRILGAAFVFSGQRLCHRKA